MSDFDSRFPAELIEQVLRYLAWDEHELTDSERWAVECACDAVIFDRAARECVPTVTNEPRTRNRTATNG